MSLEYHPQFPRPLTYSEADFDGSHAAPLLIYGDAGLDRLRERQDELASNLSNVAHEILGDIVKPGIVDFVAHSIVTRMKAREGYNSHSFHDRKYCSPRFDLARDVDPLDVLWACYRARMGMGTIDENDLAGIVYGTKSSELGNITVVGDFRSEERDAMWDELSAYVGEDVAPGRTHPYDKIKVLGFDRDISRSEHIGALRVGMTRMLPRSPRGSVLKARTFAILDASPSSGFSADTVERLKFAERTSFPLSPRAVQWLLDRELPHARVLASNDTIYRAG